MFHAILGVSWALITQGNSLKNNLIACPDPGHKQGNQGSAQTLNYLKQFQTTITGMEVGKDNFKHRDHKSRVFLATVLLSLPNKSDLTKTAKITNLFYSIMQGEGDAPGTESLHKLRSTSRILHQDVPFKLVPSPSTFLLKYVWGTLRGLGGKRGCLLHSTFAEHPGHFMEGMLWDMLTLLPTI